MGLEFEEEWRPVKNYEDRYLISNYGRIKSLRTNNIMSTFKNKDGYERITLQKNGNLFKAAIHRLVAETFIEKPETNEYLEVDHIDCNPSNNKVDNLQWVTRKENLDRSHELGNQIKLKKQVAQYDLNGNLIKIYESVNEAFRQTNIRHISEVARGEKYYHTAGGYVWKYLD